MGRRPYAVTAPGAGGDATGADRAATDIDDEDPIARRMRLEAVLLLATTPLTTRKLAQLAHLADATEARTQIRELNQIYDELGRSLKIEQIAGGYRMMTRASVAPWLTRLGHLPAATRLSSPMMETLAVVAYRQPVSRASVEAVRGVACGELLRQLMERDLIRIAGRSEELGRPYLYGTTKRFLQLFGLPSTDALPPIQWQTLQEDSPLEEDLPLEDLSTPTKESVVSTAVASVVSDTDPEVNLSAHKLAPEANAPADAMASVAVIEDEENEVFDDDDEEDYDDDFDDEIDDDDEDDDWDDEEDDDEEWDEDDDDLEDDEEDDDWEEVDDEVDDEEEEEIDEEIEEEFEDDDDEEWDDDDDDEEWEEEEDEEDWE